MTVVVPGYAGTVVTFAAGDCMKFVDDAGIMGDRFV
jgi:hypothetical protein